MDITKLGVWYHTDSMTASAAADFACLVEKLGYGALWFPEARGRNSLVHAAWLLSQTTTLVAATGIANIFARDAQAAVGGRKALDEQSGGRFLLGLGVSHAPLVENLRGHSYDKPLQRMREYLDAMGRAVYDSPAPSKSGELVLAALGSKMLELAAERTDGAHPYCTTPEHTARARSILGSGKKLYVEQKVILSTDAGEARAIARKALVFYLKADNYRRNLLTLGFTEQDLDQGSDRIIDALAVWGEKEKIQERIEQHWQAGADHVCVQPLSDPEKTIRALAPQR
jgi:probable F420-dependent oxidoreductase